ncbi:hypothetical protein SKAU_G00123640 [Synaphobranchus kaupii]|uniref:Uncharacterized protein n=1 Tax=Synaphobranchus kaupii TaxID=118154 RepID=A0A9Q1FPV6_SYNKA|nr:hypothetical protein SKAU_G00123640 [Synaphobranchus kaupii]
MGLNARLPLPLMSAALSATKTTVELEAQSHTRLLLQMLGFECTAGPPWIGKPHGGRQSWRGAWVFSDRHADEPPGAEVSSKVSTNCRLRQIDKEYRQELAKSSQICSPESALPWRRALQLQQRSKGLVPQPTGPQGERGRTGHSPRVHRENEEGEATPTMRSTR